MSSKGIIPQYYPSGYESGSEQKSFKVISKDDEPIECKDDEVEKDGKCVRKPPECKDDEVEKDGKCVPDDDEDDDVELKKPSITDGDEE